MRRTDYGGEAVSDLRRREFIGLLGSAAAAWPLAARAQAPERMQRIGVLMNVSADQPEVQARLAAFLQGLRRAGWEVGRNVRLDAVWSTGDLARLYKDAVELVALRPDVILAGVGATTAALEQATRTIPIVFAQGIDPVGNFYVESMGRPGGNATGFIQFEYSLAGKWLELLKEIAPRIARVAVLREPGAAGIGQWAIIQAVAQSFGMELKPINLAQRPEEVKRAISSFAEDPNGGLVVVVSAWCLVHKDLIIELAAHYQVPAVYPYHTFVSSGGLITYGADISSLYRQAAGYVDRILKGEKPADLPVQTPNKYELVVNLKTARSLGLDVPPALLARADQVIE
jgi:putative ABC transport system substrate-binding protein